MFFANIFRTNPYSARRLNTIYAVIAMVISLIAIEFFSQAIGDGAEELFVEIENHLNCDIQFVEWAKFNSPKDIFEVKKQLERYGSESKFDWDEGKRLKLYVSFSVWFSTFSGISYKLTRDDRPFLLKITLADETTVYQVVQVPDRSIKYPVKIVLGKDS